MSSALPRTAELVTEILRIKEDGGGYEVCAMDDKGQRVEAYFHPVTLAPVPTKAR